MATMRSTGPASVRAVRISSSSDWTGKSVFRPQVQVPIVAKTVSVCDLNFETANGEVHLPDSPVRIVRCLSADRDTAAVVGDRGPLGTTRGAHGSILMIGPGERHQEPELPACVLDDTAGTGDNYAAGSLFGVVSGEPLGRCGQIVSAVAGEIITRFGVRFPSRRED